MISIPLTLQVAVSKKGTRKSDGRTYCILEGLAVGVGLFKTFVDEKLIPDNLEGKTVNARFELGVDHKFNFSLRFAGLEGYAG